jgi:hypothetical protein
MGKIRLVYVLFGISPRIWNGLRTYTEVPLYLIKSKYNMFCRYSVNLDPQVFVILILNLFQNIFFLWMIFISFNSEFHRVKSVFGKQNQRYRYIMFIASYVVQSTSHQEVFLMNVTDVQRDLCCILNRDSFRPPQSKLEPGSTAFPLSDRHSSVSLWVWDPVVGFQFNELAACLCTCLFCIFKIRIEFLLCILLFHLLLYSAFGSWALFQYPNLYTVGRIRWTGN